MVNFIIFGHYDLKGVKPLSYFFHFTIKQDGLWKIAPKRAKMMFLAKYF